jgi:hypothetical protein
VLNSVVVMVVFFLLFRDHSRVNGPRGAAEAGDAD